MYFNFEDDDFFNKKFSRYTRINLDCLPRILSTGGAPPAGGDPSIKKILRKEEGVLALLDQSNEIRSLSSLSFKTVASCLQKTVDESSELIGGLVDAALARNDFSIYSEDCVITSREIKSSLSEDYIKGALSIYEKERNIFPKELLKNTKVMEDVTSVLSEELFRKFSDHFLSMEALGVSKYVELRDDAHSKLTEIFMLELAKKISLMQENNQILSDEVLKEVVVLTKNKYLSSSISDYSNEFSGLSINKKPDENKIESFSRTLSMAFWGSFEGNFVGGLSDAATKLVTSCNNSIKSNRLLLPDVFMEKAMLINNKKADREEVIAALKDKLMRGLFFEARSSLSRTLRNTNLSVSRVVYDEGESSFSSMFVSTVLSNSDESLSSFLGNNLSRYVDIYARAPKSLGALGSRLKDI